MDRFIAGRGRRWRVEPAPERRQAPDRFDLGEWFYRWFGPGMDALWVASAQPATLYYAYRAIEAAREGH